MSVNGCKTFTLTARVKLIAHKILLSIVENFDKLEPVHTMISQWSDEALATCIAY